MPSIAVTITGRVPKRATTRGAWGASRSALPPLPPSSV
jgi:hypothetical protein